MLNIQNWKLITEGLVIWAEDKEGDWTYSLYVMAFQKEDIQLKELVGVVVASDLDAKLENYLHLPLLLHIVGDSVFEKVIQGKKPVVSDVLGVRVEKIQDFVLQVFEEKNQSFYGAVIRKATLEHLLALIPSHQNRVLSLYLGNFLPSVLLSSFIPDFYNKDLLIKRDEKELAYQLGEITSDTAALGLEKITMQYYFRGENIDEERLEMYAHLLFLRVSPEVCTPGEYAQTYTNYISQKYKTHIFQAIAGIAFCVLAFLLIQFWSLKFQMQTNSEHYEAAQPQLEKLKQNTEKIKEYTQLSQQFTSLNQSYASWMMDKFAHVKPAEVHFTRCVFHPTEEQWKEKENQKTKEMDFLIQGGTAHSLAISTYVAQLEALPFVKKVEVLASEFNFQTELHQFSLAVNCK